MTFISNEFGPAGKGEAGSVLVRCGRGKGFAGEEADGRRQSLRVTSVERLNPVAQL
jgi:hypothetical protein